MGNTKVLESHSQPLSNEELYDLTQQLTKRQKEDEDEEDRGTKAMQTKDLTDMLSAKDMAVIHYTTLGLDLLSSTYLYTLLFLWFLVIENNSI